MLSTGMEMALGGEIICHKEPICESTAKYWISHASYSTDCEVLEEDRNDENKMCRISVVLDGGIHSLFSGMRIIIVCEETEGLKNVRIKDRIDPDDTCEADSWSRSPPRGSRNLTYRSVLTKHRAWMEESNKLLKHHSCRNKQDNMLPLCTVVFELTDSSDDVGPSVFLKLRSDTMARTPLRIIYDYAMACTPDQRMFMGFLQLKSNHFFRAIINPMGPPPSNGGYELPSIPTHMVQILPLVMQRSSSCRLPFKIIHRIVSFTLSERGNGFRRALMSFGLVCKAWLPLLDIFYEGLGYPAYPFGAQAQAQDQPLATAVARTLERNPEKAQLIKIFRSWDYSVEGDTKNQLTEAHMTILKLVTAATIIRVSSIPPLLGNFFLGTASMLKGIRGFVANTGNSRDGTVVGDIGPIFQLDTSDILKLISHWPELQMLRIIQSRDPNAQKSISAHQSDHFKASAQSHRCKLEELRILDGNISYPQLLQLISLPHPRLRELLLRNISGISNRELQSFLSHVSSSLLSLTIASCNIPRDSEEEEHAFDAVIPKMVCLERATISEHASLSAIAKKPQGTKPKYYLLLSFHDPTYELSASDVAQALQTSGWTSLMIGHSTASLGPGGWSASSREMVYRVARERGIELILHG